MSNANDFVIENGVLNAYKGKGGEIVIPEEVNEFSSVVFCGFCDPFELTLSPNMKCRAEDLLSEGITVLNIPAGTDFKCSCFGPNYSPYYKLLKEINVDPDNPSCASENGILYSKNMSVLHSCPAAHEGKVVIPAKVKKIAPRAFDGCKNLTEIIIPATVKEIGERAFMDCTALKRVVLQGEKTVIGKEAFLRCSKITTAGFMGTKDGKKSYSFEFPWTDAVPENAFSGMKKLKKVVLPESVKSIGKNAFKDCKAMEEISMAAGVKYDKKLFKDCKKLSITEGKSEAKAADDFVIQENTLASYKGKSSDVVIPDGVTVIGRKVFYGNRNIISVTIPASVTEIEQEAFYRCYNLESISILGKIKKVGSGAFPSLYQKDELALSVYSKIPISAFTKAGQCDVIHEYIRRFPEFSQDTEVYRDNLNFIGKHLKLSQGKYSDKYCYHYLIENKELRHAVFAADAIPAKEIDWLTETIQAEGDAEFTAELLEYKNRLLSDKKVKKKLEKSAERAEEKALSDEVSAAEWRKRLKFSYENEDIVIKKIKIWDTETVIPAQIGKRRVRVIDKFAIDHHCEHEEPEKLIISEGIEEIRELAFMYANNIEIFFPGTLTCLPKECFGFALDLTLHIPASVTAIAINPEDENESAFKAIYAPAGSYAEQYAKEHNIPFVAE